MWRRRGGGQGRLWTAGGGTAAWAVPSWPGVFLARVGCTPSLHLWYSDFLQLTL